jgi:type IV secretory pathway VirB2 component (pilin)
MANEIDIYNTIRTEIVANHTLMHWYSIIVALTLLSGIVLIEIRKTALSVFLPLLSLSWAASMVRFDFFIQRQGAYLRDLERQILENGISSPMWETWKSSLRSTQSVVPIADTIAVLAIVIPTLYLLFGPAQEVFQLRHWKGAKVYAWGISILLALLLCSLAVIPRLASWRQ